MATESTGDTLTEERVVYILTNLDGTHRGVYKSKAQLIVGVDFWIFEKPDQSLIYELWYAPGQEEITWDFAFVSSDEYDRSVKLAEELHIGGSVCPEVIGANLISYKREPKS